MDKNDWKRIFRAFSLITQLGLGIIVNMGVGFGLGYIVDNLTGSRIFFKLAGLIIGIGAGFYADYRLIKGIMGDDNNESG